MDYGPKMDSKNAQMANKVLEKSHSHFIAYPGYWKKVVNCRLSRWDYWLFVLIAIALRELSLSRAREAGDSANIGIKRWVGIGNVVIPVTHLKWIGSWRGWSWPLDVAKNERKRKRKRWLGPDWFFTSQTSEDEWGERRKCIRRAMPRNLVCSYCTSNSAVHGLYSSPDLTCPIK